MLGNFYFYIMYEMPISVSTATTDDNTEMVARILLARRVKKNDYGESIFYKKNGEILAAVFPKFGRLLLWNASLPYTYRPPAMSYVQGLYCLTVRMSTSKETMDQSITKTQVLWNRRKRKEGDSDKSIGTTRFGTMFINNVYTRNKLNCYI